MPKKILLSVLLLCLSTAVWAQSTPDESSAGNAAARQDRSPALRADHPDRYVVQKGDTLWDIAGKFLNNPWRWPEIWYANPQIENPHLIYPGDVISLIYVGGEPRLTVNRGDGHPTKVLHPRVRVTPHKQAINAIPLSAIRPFLTGTTLMSKAEIDSLPYVVANAERRLAVGEFGRTYVMNLDVPEGTPVRIGRPGSVFYAVDEPPPAVRGEDWKLGGGTTISNGLESAWDAVVFWEDEKILGYEVITIAEGVVVDAGQPATVAITESFRAVGQGDVVLTHPSVSYDARYVPHTHPDPSFKARVIALTDAAYGAGQYQVIALDKGRADGVENGQVYTVYHPGRTIRDTVKHPRDDVKSLFLLEDPSVTLPPEKIGEAMVFRTFDQISYALVMEAKQPVRLYDLLVNPED